MGIGPTELIIILVILILLAIPVFIIVSLVSRPKTMTMYPEIRCHSCGKRNLPDARICSYCGKSLIYQPPNDDSTGKNS
jgi:rRNA maturation endonuclease Nob1